MSALAHAAHHTFRDYLALEASGNVKHEFYAGEIYAMAGGTPTHAALQVAVPSLLFPQIRHGACRAHGADLRVRVLATGLATYPDVTVVCGPRELDPEDANTVVNPTLLVEVLSPSTAEYDRGGQAVSPEAPGMTKARGATGRLGPSSKTTSSSHRCASTCSCPPTSGGSRSGRATRRTCGRS